MAVSTVQTNNKLVKYTQEINREWVKEDMFAAYTGEDVTSVIRRKMELKAGGEQMNIPIVARLSSAGVSTGTLVGNEEEIDDYGYRIRIDWARNAVVTKKSEQQKDSADTFGEAKPLLSDWAKELKRDEIIAALMALPTETLPSDGVRVNGIQYDLATATQRGQWQSDNADRVLFGALTTNRVASAVATDHAASLVNIDTTADKFTAANLSLLKRVASMANPRIRPIKTKDGYEFYICFAGSNTFRDLTQSMETIHKDSMPRERISADGRPDNPIYTPQDLMYDGVIVRMVPEISLFVTNVWTNLLTAGATSARVEPVFLCGQQALAWAIGQMQKPTFRDETDYGFVKGIGIEMAYGIGKLFKRHPKSGTPLKQWAVATGFFASASD